MEDANGLNVRDEQEDEHSIVLKMLTSEDWQKRLVEARQAREKILASKPAVLSTLSAPLRPGRIGAEPPAIDETFDEDDEEIEEFPDPLPPTRLFPTGRVGPPPPELNPPATALVVPLSPPPRPRNVENLPALVEPGPIAATLDVADTPKRGISLRLMGGFAIGLLAGAAATSVMWMNRPDLLPSGESVEIAADGPQAPLAEPEAATVAAVEAPVVAAPTAPTPVATEPAAPAPSAVDDLAGPSGLGPSLTETGAGPVPGLAVQVPATAASPGPLSEPDTERPPEAVEASSAPAVQALTPVVQTSIAVILPPTTDAAAVVPGGMPVQPAATPAGPAAPEADRAAGLAGDAGLSPQPMVQARMASLAADMPDADALVPAGVTIGDAALPVALRQPDGQDAAPSAAGLPPPPVLAPGTSVRPRGPVPAEPLVLASPVTVKVLAPGGLVDAEVDKLAGGLRTSGYTVGDTTHVTVKVSETHVRYYHPADRAQAEALALRFNGAARDFTGASGDVPEGTVELWLEGAAPKVAKAKTAKTKAKASGTRKAQAAKPKQEDPQVRALRERVLGKLKKVNKS